MARSAARGAALAGLGLALLVWALLRAQALPSGPEPVAWDREPCARCRMLIGQPGFAAQLQTRDGRVLFFDDPGCLLLYRSERDPELHAAWFHHRAEERWIPLERVAFVPVPSSPMGYDLAAVDTGGGTLSYDEALARSAGLEAGRQER